MKKLEIRAPAAETMLFVVYEALRKAIADGRLQPGERLVERQLADEMGVSRTPVREALHQLERDRLVVNVPYRGYSVATVGQSEAMTLYETRLMLEPKAAGLAARNITSEQLEVLRRFHEEGRRALERNDIPGLTAANAEFHLMIAEASNNKWVRDILHRLQGYISLLRRTSMDKSERTSSIIEEHEQILNSIAARDSQAAEIAVERHLQAARHNLVSVYTDGSMDQRGS